MKLSQNFTTQEFACRCGCGFDQPNPRLVTALEELRAKLGNRSIVITSGCRCDNHNRNVGGSPSSQHLRGAAADIAVYGISGADLYLYSRDIPDIKGFGAGKTWAHIDVRIGREVRWRYDITGRVVPW